MNSIVNIAFRNLLQAPRRTALLTLALGIVTMLLVLLLALSQGMTETMIRSATTLMAGHINVSGFLKLKPDDAIPLVMEKSKVRKLVEENTPGLDYVIDRMRGWAKVISPTSSFQAGLWGIDLDEERHFLDVIELAKESEYKKGGREEVFGDLDKLREPRAAMLFASQAERLEVVVGDQLTINTRTTSGLQNTIDVTVVAIAKDIGMMSTWNVFLTKEAILDLYTLQPDTTGAIMVFLKDYDNATEAMGHLRKVLGDAGYELMEHDPRAFFMKFDPVSAEEWTGQKLDLTIWRDEVNFLEWQMTLVSTVSLFLLGILTIIIMVGITNTMWIAVRERTQEVGTMRAIGMSRLGILLLFLTEALILGLAATLGGALLGAGIAAAVDAAGIVVGLKAIQLVLMSQTLHMAVEWGHVLAAVGVFTLVSGLAALWPAYRASRLQPVTAIHSVN